MGHRSLVSVFSAPLLFAAAIVLALTGGGYGLAPAPAGAVPVNDNLANAQFIGTPNAGGVAAAGDSTGATNEVGEQVAFTSSCQPASNTANVSNAVWFTWTSPGTPGTAVFDTVGSNFDTVLAFYTGSGYPLSLTACNDDRPSQTGARSAVVLSYTASTTYRIQLGGYNGATGSYVLNQSMGSIMYVNSASNLNANLDGILTLNDAITLGNGSMLYGVMDASEQAQILGNTPGASVKDLVHFNNSFDINIDAMMSTLGNGVVADHVSGVGYTVEIDGGGTVPACLVVLPFSKVTGLLVRRCLTGIFSGSGRTEIGGSMSAQERNVVRENNTGIEVGSFGDDTIVGNYIGTDATGTAAMGNGTGVYITGGADFVDVGGVNAASRNVISGNGTGVLITGFSTDNNVVQGNYIGLNAAGTSALPNGNGVFLDTDATGNKIGSGLTGIYPDSRNIISGNSTGIVIESAHDNLVRGNYIGLRPDGDTAAANFNGILVLGSGSGNVIGGTTADERNVMSGNTNAGILLQGVSGNYVRGNYIGINAAGTADRPNGLGVTLSGGSAGNTIGGTTPADRNVISGNNGHGVYMGGTAVQNNIVLGNYIGLNPSGGATAGFGNFNGIFIETSAGANQIGNGTSAGRNVISGNDGRGVVLLSDGNAVKGNYIGTNATGLATVANASGGVLVGSGSNTIGGYGPGDVNVISGNQAFGISLDGAEAVSNSIIRNYVGVDRNGSLPLANSHGVLVSGGANGNLVGDVGAGNVIALNSNVGVQVEGPSSSANTVRGNSIFANTGAIGSGIALVNGGNDNIEPPVVTGVTGAAIFGTACPGCTVDVYSDEGNQGRYYHGNTAATLGGTFTFYGAMTGARVTAIVTDGFGNTSRFSEPAYAELCDGADNDFDFVADEGHPDSDADGRKDCVDSGLMTWDAANSLPTPTVDCTLIAEDFDAFKDGDGCPEPDNDNDGFPDGTDACPGTGAQAGNDGMLGSPEDFNHNGVRDAGPPWNEPALTTDDSPLALSFEDYDNVLDTDGCHDSPGGDFDGDGLTDDAEVFTHLTDAGNPDTDADTVIDGTDNCPNWPNTPQNLPPWTVPATDSDCDGFTLAREQWTGTNPTKHCNLTTTANDEAIDFWPSDFNDSRLTSLADVVLMGPVYNQSTGTEPAKKRFDLNASGVVSLADVVLMGPFYNKNCG